MELSSAVTALLERFLEGRPDLFLVDLKISNSDDIVIIIDGDNGVSIQDCLDVSRAIEFNIDKDEVDFSLQVMSAGLSEPLVSRRQYKKNIGRELEITTIDSEKIKGILQNVEDGKISLLLKYRKPKEVGKGKMDVEEIKEILYNEIQKALVVIKF